LWYNKGAVDITHHPKLIHPTAYVAPNATIVGEVHVAARASVWFSSVLRGDNAPIIIGERTNVQDLCIIHVDEEEPCTLGVGVTVGHRAVLHSATIEDWALIGIGAVVLNGAVVGQEALVGAGALVTQGMIIPPLHLALGVPARVVRRLTDEEVAQSHRSAARYVAHAQAFMNATASTGG
jgi:carbonic anhydrase/acetyltransferase-like protein (isoleucine patch superfamily)